MTESEHRALSDKFMLRMPDGMRDRIKRAAEANGRSMNSEILAVLHQKYPEPIPGADSTERLQVLAQRIAEETDPEQLLTRLGQFRREFDLTLVVDMGEALARTELEERD